MQALGRLSTILTIPPQPDASEVENIAVVDALGEVFERIRELPLPVALWRVLEPRPLSPSVPIRFTIYAAYAPIDWELISDLAVRTPTVIVTTTYQRDEAAEALRREVMGYLDLGLPPQTFDRALRGALLNGEPGFSRAVLGEWMRERRAPAQASRNAIARLTSRQREIITLIASGATDKEIAATLGIAPATAQKHVSGILRRLSVPNRAAAVAVARPAAGPVELAGVA